jgi:hypothetical protein
MNVGVCKHFFRETAENKKFLENGEVKKSLAQTLSR